MAFVAALAIGVSSCGKDFLDEKPSQYLSPGQISDATELDPGLAQGNIDGVYALMYKTGTGGTNLSHDDFGQKGYDIYSDMIASDMALGSLIYGWYGGVANYNSTTDYTNTDAYKPWRYYYQIGLAANATIELLGGADAELEGNNVYIMGQAKAMRAYAYFYLAQFYSTGYGTGAEKILPIYRNTQVPNQPKSTSKEVYDFIVENLEEAIVHLEGFNRASSAKNQINQDVAKGLLAYTLAARGSTEDLERVVTLTDEIINSGAYPLTTRDEVVAKFEQPLTESSELLNPESGFNDVNTPSWMWGVDLTLDSDLDLVSWWGQVDLFTYSYAYVGDAKIIDDGLYAEIAEDDIRKDQFVDVNDNGQLWPINKFYWSGRTKFLDANEEGGQRYIVTDYVYMRVEEMYLLNAEAKAKLGQDGPARERLKELLELRVEDYSYVDALSGQALEDEIYLQTRIEMWGEGKSYLAMKRNKATITRGSNHLEHAGESFPYDANELTFPIPQAEVLNNPFLNQ